MKVLFANPPWWDGFGLRYGFLPQFRAGCRAGSRWPHTYPTFSVPGMRLPFDATPAPLFMGYAASYVRRHASADVVLRDSLARREQYGQFFNFVRRGEFDFIFIEGSSPSWTHDKGLIRRLRQIAPRSRLVVTGPITIEHAPDILAALPVTACIKGEYEKNAVKVVQGATGIIEQDFMSAEEMNQAPPPLHDEATIRHYYDRNPRGGRFPHLEVWSSRGCPFKCIFCVWPATMTGIDPDGHGRRMVRYYVPDHLEPYITDMVGRYRFRSIYFDDDTFNLGNRHTLEMCAMMRRIGLPWAAMCRTDTIDLNAWDEMKASGCYGVKLGFESGDQTVVDTIVNKNLDLQQAVGVVKHLKRIGLKLHGTFTIGLPGETPEQIRRTLAFARSLPLDSLQISGTAVIEGTPLHRRVAASPESSMLLNAKVNMTDGNKKSAALLSRLR